LNSFSRLWSRECNSSGAKSCTRMAWKRWEWFKCKLFNSM